MNKNSRPSGFGHAMKLTVLLLAIGAAAISGYLTWTIGFAATPAGCGEESGCGQVLASHWSRLLGIPVSLLGLVLHLTTVGCVLRFPSDGWQRSTVPRMLVCVCVVGLAGAAWFIFAQGILLKQFCFWCMTTHGLAIAYCLMVLGLVLNRSNPDLVDQGSRWVTPRQFGISGMVGVLSVASLIAIQVAQFTQPPEPMSMVTDQFETKIQSSLSQSERGRVLSLYDEKVEILVDEFPSLGKQDTPSDVLFLYDYCCPACRLHHGYLQNMIEAFPDVRVTLLPVSLNSECNEYWENNSDEFADSCHLIKLALAVWRIDQEKFIEFDQWLCAGDTRGLEEARSRAKNLVGAQRLAESLDDPWILETLKTTALTLETSDTASVPTFLPLTDKGLKF